MLGFGSPKDYKILTYTYVDNSNDVHVVFWGHAAKELRDAASQFINLDNYLTIIGI